MKIFKLFFSKKIYRNEIGEQVVKKRFLFFRTKKVFSVIDTSIPGGVILPSLNLKNVGKHSYCSTPPIIANSDETKIGSFVSIGNTCCLGSGEHPMNFLSTSPYFYLDKLGFKKKDMPSHNEFDHYAPIKIGNDVWIGNNVFIKNGIHIGNGAIIGAGAVVTKDVPPYAIVVGVPAKVIRYRFDEQTIEKLLKLEWWNLPDEIIKQIPYDDIDKALNFIEKYNEQNT